MIGYNLWRSEQIKDVTDQQITAYYKLYNQNRFDVVYKQMTTNGLKSEVSLEQFTKVLKAHNKKMGGHQSIINSQNILTFHLNPAFRYFKTAYENKHQRGKSVDHIMWLKEEGFWKIHVMKAVVP